MCVALLALGGLALAGCPEIATCAEGEVRDNAIRACVPASDAARDADGAEPADAGPCGVVCSGDTPYCNETLGACVACLDSSHCTTPGALACRDDGVCVECTLPLHCELPERSRCEASSCVACAGTEDCEHLGLTPVCDTARMRCVQCTGATEAEYCNAFSCRRSDGTCTSTPRDSRNVCQPCEADSECMTGQRCVVDSIGGVEVGSFCFYDQAVGGCGDSVAARRPYSTPTPLDSVDAVGAVYCMPPSSTTCAGIFATRSVACSVDTQCGVADVADGYCPTPLCSYLCTGDVDCPSGLVCSTSAPRHCRLP